HVDQKLRQELDRIIATMALHQRADFVGEALNGAVTLGAILIDRFAYRERASTVTRELFATKLFLHVGHGITRGRFECMPARANRRDFFARRGAPVALSLFVTRRRDGVANAAQSFADAAGWQVLCLIKRHYQPSTDLTFFVPLPAFQP